VLPNNAAGGAVVDGVVDNVRRHEHKDDEADGEDDDDDGWWVALQTRLPLVADEQQQHRLVPVLDGERWVFEEMSKSIDQD